LYKLSPLFVCKCSTVGALASAMGNNDELDIGSVVPTEVAEKFSYSLTLNTNGRT